MAYTRMEQETSIVWDDEEKLAHIYTSSSVSLRKLERLCKAFPGAYEWVWEERDADGRLTAAKYRTESRRIRFVKPASEARVEQGRRIAAMAAQKRKNA